MTPKVKLDESKQVSKTRIKQIFAKCLPDKSGVIIPGSSVNFGLSASVDFI